MPQDPKAERRQFERIEREDAIQIKEYSYPERGSYQAARILDLSGGGLSIETTRFFPEKTQLKIEMNITGWQRHTVAFLRHFGRGSRTPLVVLGEVVRCTAIVPGRRYEVALEFTGIDESHRRALIKFIRELLGGRRSG